MPTRRTLIVLILLLVGAALFLHFGSQPTTPASGDPTSDTRGQMPGSGKSPDSSDSCTTKLREREPKKDHGIDEMFAGLREILPGSTEFPEQSLQDRILAINALLKKAGIKPRVDMDEVLYPSPHLLEKNVPAFSQENATLNHILLQAESALKMSHYLNQGEGTVLLNEGSGG